MRISVVLAAWLLAGLAPAVRAGTVQQAETAATAGGACNAGAMLAFVTIGQSSSLGTPAGGSYALTEGFLAGAYLPVLTLLITNGNMRVASAAAAWSIGGTVSQDIVGDLTWTNARNGTGGTLAACSPWTLRGAPLAYGPNVITVSGTNCAGVAAWSTLTITCPFNGFLLRLD